MTRRLPAWPCALLLSAAAIPNGSAAAALPTDDSPGGMTCHYALAAAELAWQRLGGDWTDAAGAAHGSQAFASAEVRRAKPAQTVEWDVTALVRAWRQPAAWAGALHLRRGNSGRGGTVDFASREHPEAADRPKLELDWSDGQRTAHGPAADSHLACPSFRSSGGAAQLRVAADQGAVLLFELPSRNGAQVVKARLVMTSVRQTGSGGVVEVFAGRHAGGASEFESGLAAGFSRDAGIERHPDVWLVERFEPGGKRPAWLSQDDAERIESARAAAAGQRFEPIDGAAAAVTLRQGTTQALNSHIRFASRPGGEPQEAFFRYYLRFADNWNPTLDGGKLPGFSGTYGRAGWGGRRADGVNGWSARGSFYPQTAGNPAWDGYRAIGNYVYHGGMTSRYGDGWGWNLGPTGLLQKNRWYSIEQQVRLNTPGQPDGVLRTWVDGRLAFSRNDIRFRDSPELRIESVWMNVYHGGTKPAPRDLTLFIDNLVVAGRYIGPMAPAAARP